MRAIIALHKKINLNMQFLGRDCLSLCFFLAAVKYLFGLATVALDYIKYNSDFVS